MSGELEYVQIDIYHHYARSEHGTPSTSGTSGKLSAEEVVALEALQKTWGLGLVATLGQALMVSAVTINL